MDVANACSLTCEEERNSCSTPTSNWWFYISACSSNFEGASLASVNTEYYMAWTLEVIPK